MSRLRRITMNLFRTVLGVGIQVKIMGMVMGLILFFGMSVTILVRVTLASSLESQLESQGIALARDIAARSTEDILTRNTFALFELARDTIENNQDVRYIFLLDTQGNVVYHSFPGPFPADLLTVNPVFGTQPYSVELLDTEEGLIRDIAAPIFGGRVGVAHIGMSQRRLGATVDEATTRIIWSTGIALIIGLCASFILTYFMTTPIQELAEVSRAVGRGDLTRRATIWFHDEVGQLAQIFNTTVTELQRRAEENERLTDELREKEKVRGQLLQKVIAAQEDERKRISRELHDETGQSLTSLMVGLRMIEEATTLEEARQRAGDLRTVAGQTLDNVRSLARELRPSVLDDIGLVPALERYTHDYGLRHHIAADFQAVNADGHHLSPEVSTALYRIVQEALTNVARHAQAHSVSVLLDCRNETVRVIVEDDGRGFDVAQVLSRREHDRHLGLLGIRERVELLGGTMTIESQPGAGTTLYVEIPLAQPPSEMEG